MLERETTTHWVMNSLVWKLKGSNTDNNQQNTEYAHERQRISEKHNADNERTGTTDTGPDRVRRPNGYALLSKPEEVAAQSHETQGDCNAEPARLRGLRNFYADRPAYLKKAGQKQIDPTHAQIFIVNYKIIPTQY